MFYKKNRFSNQKGQALLIVVLVMVIGLTIGLSVASRTIINLRNTNDQAASQKALSAAEAGIERAIKNPEVSHISGYFPGTGSITSSNYQTTVSQINGSGNLLLNGGVEVTKNDAIYVWVTPYSDNFSTSWSGQLTIYWGDGTNDCSTNNAAALEVSVIYGPTGCTGAACKDSPNLKRYVFDPCSNRVSSNHFDSNVTTAKTPMPGATGEVDLNYYKTINLSNYAVLLVRINPIYKESHIGVSGIPANVSQGNNIISTGTANQNTRKITVYEGFPEVPAEFFPYTLFQP
jgi:Tfp pilus assembly protein PilX